MKRKCNLCGVYVEEEEFFCETCLDVLRKKYPDKKEFEKILQWHINHTQLNKKC